MRIPTGIFLYPEGEPIALLEEMRDFLQRKSRIKSEVNLFSFPQGNAYYLASLRIKGPRGERFPPLPREVELEEEGLRSNSPPKGVVYDGWGYMRFMRSLLPSRNPHQLHIIITKRLLSTPEGGVHHIRTALFGYPCIVSTSGLVEGPAKPREFYVARRLLGEEGALVSAEGGKFLSYDDPRLPRVLKGYLLQCLFYHLIGDPFCEDKGCSLYNAHWQEELIYAQIESPYELCPFHSSLLEQL